MTGAASKLANSETDGRSIGSGVIVSKVAADAATVGLVLFADLSARVALAAFFVMFILVLGADLYVQRHDMDGADPIGAATGD